MQLTASAYGGWDETDMPLVRKRRYVVFDVADLSSKYASSSHHFLLNGMNNCVRVRVCGEQCQSMALISVTAFRCVQCIYFEVFCSSHICSATNSNAWGKINVFYCINILSDLATIEQLTKLKPIVIIIASMHAHQHTASQFISWSLFEWIILAFCITWCKTMLWSW